MIRQTVGTSEAPNPPNRDEIREKVEEEVLSETIFKFNKHEPEKRYDFQQVVVIDGIPRMSEEKAPTFTKLLYKNVISKCSDDPEVKAIAKSNKNHLYVPIDEETKTGTGYCFVRFAQKRFARNCVERFNEKTPFGESYPLHIYYYDDLIDFMNAEDEFIEPPYNTIPGFENRLDWLIDPRARSQFIVQDATNNCDGNLTGFFYDEITPPEEVFSKALANSTASAVSFTHHGSFLTFLNSEKGELRVALASNISTNFVLKHEGIISFFISPCERFAATIARTGRTTERPRDETGVDIPDSKLDPNLVSCIGRDIYEIRVWSIWEQRILGTATPHDFEAVRSFISVDGSEVDFRNILSFSGNSAYLLIRRPTGFRVYRIATDNGVYTLSAPEIFAFQNIVDISFAPDRSCLLAIFQGIKRGDNKPCNVQILNLMESDDRRTVCCRAFHVDSGHFVWHKQGRGICVVTEKASRSTIICKCFIFRLCILYDQQTGRYLPSYSEGRRLVKQYAISGGGYNIPVETVEFATNNRVTCAEWTSDARQLAFSAVPVVIDKEEDLLGNKEEGKQQQNTTFAMMMSKSNEINDGLSSVFVVTLNDDISKSFRIQRIPDVTASSVAYSNFGNYLVAVTNSTLDHKSGRITFINTQTCEVVADHDQHPLENDDLKIDGYAWDPTGRYVAVWSAIDSANILNSNEQKASALKSDILIFNCFGVPCTKTEAFRRFQNRYIINFIWRPLDANLTLLSETDRREVDKLLKTERAYLEEEDEHYIKRIKNEAVANAKERITDWEKKRRQYKEFGNATDKVRIRALRECYSRDGLLPDFCGYTEKGDRISSGTTPALYQKVSTAIEQGKIVSTDNYLSSCYPELLALYNDYLSNGFRVLN